MTNAKPLMSSETHGPTKHVGFDVMVIKSEHLQICVCPYQLKLMESQKSWLTSCQTMKVKGYRALKKKGAICPQKSVRQLLKSIRSLHLYIHDDMVKAKEVERELARSLSPTPGQTPKAPMKMTKTRLRALHCRQ